MRPDIPPDFLGVIDAIGLDQQVDEALVFAVTRKVIRDIRAGELIEDFAAVGFEPGIHAAPERRIRGKSQDMRKEVARRIHDVYGRFGVFDADMDVQAEDEIGARHHLQVFDDGPVALIRVDLLFAPVGERVGSGGRQAQAILMGQLHHLMADQADFLLGLMNIAANPRAHFDHRLVHLGFDPLDKYGLALLQDFEADVRAEVAGLRVDSLILFLNADG
jgi:hypothetical protein